MMFKLRPVKHFDFTKRVVLPGCGHKFGLYVPGSLSIDAGNYMWLPGRLEAFCNNCACDQRFWLLTRTGRVQRRHVGETLSERRTRLGHI